MHVLREQEKTMQMRSKVLIGICCLLVVIVALSFSGIVGSGKKSGSSFKWSTGGPHDTVVQVTTGKAAIVPFEFRVEGKVSTVSLAIGDASLQEKGIAFEETVIAMKNGVAFSKVIFNIRPESRLRAGHYHLTIIARDAATGRIVSEGELLFNLDMLDLIWRCSC
jgi:hypothetical protein